LLHAGRVVAVFVVQVIYGDIRLLSGWRPEHAVAFEGQYIPGSVVGEAGRVPVVLPFGVEDGITLCWRALPAWEVRSGTGRSPAPAGVASVPTNSPIIALKESRVPVIACMC
jgi:hypothetical protein